MRQPLYLSLKLFQPFCVTFTTFVLCTPFRLTLTFASLRTIAAAFEVAAPWLRRVEVAVPVAKLLQGDRVRKSFYQALAERAGVGLGDNRVETT